MKTESPILFVIFNRFDCTVQSFNIIRDVQPKYLYVASDGPRKGNQNDIKSCKQCRDYVLENIDWDCEVKTLFRHENLGCGRGASEAITWFFNNVEYGIIIEDDVLLAKEFFIFCDQLLPKFLNNERIMQISSFNPCIKNKQSDRYYFTSYPRCWGWATWKRAWGHFDFAMTEWLSYKKSKKYKQIFPFWECWIHTKVWDRIFADIQKGEVLKVWDYQWALEVFINRGICIVPGVNLAKNIGIGENATNCFDVDHRYNDLKFGELNFPIKGNKKIEFDKKIVRLDSLRYLKDRIRGKLYKFKSKIGL